MWSQIREVLFLMTQKFAKDAKICSSLWPSNVVVLREWFWYHDAWAPITNTWGVYRWIVREKKKNSFTIALVWICASHRRGAWQGNYGEVERSTAASNPEIENSCILGGGGVVARATASIVHGHYNVCKFKVGTLGMLCEYTAPLRIALLVNKEHVPIEEKLALCEWRLWTVRMAMVYN